MSESEGLSIEESAHAQQMLQDLCLGSVGLPREETCQGTAI